jgi:hypothetical protein
MISHDKGGWEVVDCIVAKKLPSNKWSLIQFSRRFDQIYTIIESGGRDPSHDS